MQERLRGHTQIVRNWGYFANVVQIARDLYAPLDADLRQHHGFSASDLIAVSLAVIEGYQSRVNSRFSILKTVFRERTVSALVHRYFELYPGVVGNPKAYLASLHPKATLKWVKGRLLSHSDGWATRFGIVELDQIQASTGLERTVIEAILNALSRTADGDTATPIEHIFLANPIWTAPGLKDGDQFFFVLPQTIFCYIHPIVSRLAEAAGLAKKLEKRRAKFLEESVEATLRTVLPGATITPGAKWSWEGRDYETDALVSLDRTLLIAEAKSGVVSPLGLRGSADRMKRHVRELIVDPSEQSGRLASIIALAESGDAAALAVTSGLGLDPRTIRKIVRVSVTLDDFSIVASAEPTLELAGLKPAGVELAPTLGLADFQVVAELLSTPAPFLHYLAERGPLQRVGDILADELDFLGFYLECGFNRWDVYEKGQRVLMSGMSLAVDRYYTSRDAGHPIPRPTPKVSPLVAGIVEALEARRPNGWTMMALDLLGAMSLEEQDMVSDTLTELAAEAPAKSAEGRQGFALVSPPPFREGLILFGVYEPGQDRAVELTAEHQIAQALDDTGRARCLVIGKRTDCWSQPYNLIAMAYDNEVGG